MNATIDKDGVMVITPSTMTEAYALKGWAEANAFNITLSSDKGKREMSVIPTGKILLMEFRG